MEYTSSNLNTCTSRWKLISWYLNTNTPVHEKSLQDFFLLHHQEQKNCGKQNLSGCRIFTLLDLFSFFGGFAMISGRCAACKNQRRKCPSDCIFAPYFPPNDPQRYVTVHRIYGGSNIGRMLQQIPPYVRAQAADCLYYEARCRIQDPVYGCFGIISQLVQQIHNTQSELTKTQAQIDILKFQIPQDVEKRSTEQFQASWFE